MDAKNMARLALGALFITTGIGHLSFAKKEFRAQVPDWVPLPKDKTVEYSGYAELALATAIITVPKKHRKKMGYITAAFLAAVFDGNYEQWRDRKDCIALDTDAKRFGRLFLQAPLIYWALKSMDEN